MPAAALLLLAAAPPAAGPPPDGAGPGPAAFAVESFEEVRPGGPVLGTDGGTGWAGPWAGRPFTLGDQPDPARYPPRADTFLGMADSLPHGNPAVRAAARGGSASAVALGEGEGVGMLSRPLARRLGVPGQTVYLGVLMRAEGVLHRGAALGGFGVTLQFNLPGPDEEARLRRESLRWYRKMGQQRNSLSLGKGLAGRAYIGRDLPVSFRRPFDRSEVWQLWRIGSFQITRAGGEPIPSAVPGFHESRRSGLHHEVSVFGDGRASTGVSVVPGRTTLLICELAFRARNGTPEARWSAWVDPDPHRPERPRVLADWFEVKDSFAGVRFTNDHVPIDVRAGVRRPSGETTWVTLIQTGATTVDEIRFADTLRGACGLSPVAE